MEYLTLLSDKLAEHPYVLAGIMVLLAFVAAWVVDRSVVVFVKKLASKTESELDDQVLDIIHKPLFYSVLVWGLSTAATLLEMPAAMHGRIFPLIYTALLVLWTLFAIRFSRLVLRRLAADDRRFVVLHSQTLPLFENVVFLTILGLSIYATFSSWNVDMTAWLASAGIIGIAVGFAAKDTLANLLAGVLIMADAPYKIKDYVVLETGERGAVTNIGLRSTRILTRDHIEITVPNSIMGNTKIINESAGLSTSSRIRAKIACAYGSDIELVEKILLGVAAAEKDMCEDPPPVVRMRGFGDSSLDFELMGWIDQPGDRGRVLHQIYGAVYRAFAEHNVMIPFPQRDLHIKEMPKRSSLEDVDST
ncbi:mechanosensitive ion channel family protein [Opitutaceae bacterium]|nr:mechanosensitive ion channel family protein [Opitutaceae bacterium]